LKTLIIDGNNYAAIAQHRISSNIMKSNPEKFDEWILGGFGKLFKQMLEKLKREFNPQAVYVAWDMPGGSQWRKDASAEYKGNRTYPPYMRECHNIGKNIAEELDFCNVELPCEADDTVYALCQVIEGRKILVSRDNDFIQIVQEGLAENVYDPTRKINLPIPEYDIVLYKCLVGDSSDNIAGIKGIGPATAQKLLREGIPASLQEQIQPLQKIIALSNHPQKEQLREAAKEIVRSHVESLGLSGW
jgi:5'-3' exonuclease